jgi:diguanylate cyclase (GGDEF)-like protein
VRSAAYVATGLLVGWLGVRNRMVMHGLRELADTDHLTGLRNSRAFERELASRCEGERRFALLVGDVDGLKAVNDRDGHAAGNVLLRRVANALQDTLRDGDVSARIGGDEFGLLAAATDERDAASLAARLERQLARRGSPVSFGWALYPASGRTPEALFDRADERLYRTKGEGRRASAG